MAKLIKSNRVVNVDDNQVDSYLKRGYDEVDDFGNVITYAKSGRTVSLSEYNRVLEKLNEANNGNETKNGETIDEMEKRKDEAITKLEERCTELYNQVEEYKEKAEEFAEKGRKLQEENEKLKKQGKK